MSKEKVCFVIAPIGSDGSDIRKRSDQIFKHVIEPVAKEHGYTAVRADHMSQPGSITTQIVEQILSAPLVVADLTGHNANVLYELAIRHVVRKPVVQLIQKGEGLPFDVAAQRTIQVDYKDLDSVELAKAELSKQIASVVKDPTQVDSPVSMALDLSALRSSTKPVDTTLVEIISLLREIRAEQQVQLRKQKFEASRETALRHRRRTFVSDPDLTQAVRIRPPLTIRESLQSRGITPGEVFEEAEEASEDSLI